MKIAKVYIEIPLVDVNVPFDYLVKDDQEVQKGVRVEVLFSRRILVGYVVDVIESDLTLKEYEEQNGYELSPIRSILDETPLINDELEQVVQFLATDYLAPNILCYQTILPPSLQPNSKKKTDIKKRLFVAPLDTNTSNLTPTQLACYEALGEGMLLSKLEYSKTVVDNLVKKGAVEIRDLEVYRDPFNEEVNPLDPPLLTQEQQYAINDIISSNKSTFLLQGVTGSGKTEIYINLAIYYLKKGKNVIILVPEISLTPLMVRRFKARISEGIAIFHSGLTPGEKYDEYRRIKRQEVRVVIGARSAVFAPLENLGIIIIDEEHSETYKNETAPTYHAREVALFRASLNNCKLVLGSATPSLDSRARAQKKVYQLITLNKRISSHGMPKVHIVDMVEERHRGNYTPLSKFLQHQINETIDQNGQVILLMNKRGFAKVVECRNCGYVYKCPNCEVALTYHKDQEQLACHYCGYTIPRPTHCEQCGSQHLRYSGFGIERVEEFLRRDFPILRIVRMDQDTVKRKNGHRKILDAFENRQYDILLGTQMIAKGLDFSNVTLVGVVNADIGLGIDFRSSERIFQLLAQVAGRSGRGEKKGIALIQTNNPTHYAIQTASKHSYEMFYGLEMQRRRQFGYPPYTYLALLTFAGKSQKSVDESALNFKKEILELNLEGFEVLGPSQPYIKRYKDDYRMRILIKSKNKEKMNELLHERCFSRKWKNVKVTIDIDPLEEN